MKERGEAQWVLNLQHTYDDDDLNTHMMMTSSSDDEGKGERDDEGDIP